MLSMAHLPALASMQPRRSRPAPHAGCAGHPLHEQAQRLLEAHNPNDNKNSAKGLEGLQRRFVKFGGGISAAQLSWLDGQLSEAASAGERVVCLCHLAFHPDSVPPMCLLWNFDEVLQVRATGVSQSRHPGGATPPCAWSHMPCSHLPDPGPWPLASPPFPQLLQRYPGTVVGTLAGHAHSDGFATDSAGIRHRVCKAVLETPPGRCVCRGQRGMRCVWCGTLCHQPGVCWLQPAARLPSRRAVQGVLCHLRGAL